MARMPDKGGRIGPASLALLASVFLLSAVAAQALAKGNAPGLAPPPPPPSTYESECVAGAGSPQGYPDASPAEAADLLTRSFPCILDSLAAEPADPESASATVSGEPRGGAVPGDQVVSTPPLLAMDESGQEVAVDLSLEPTTDGFAPTNPLVDLTLPADLGHEVAIGDRGIAIDIGATDPDAASAASAEPLAGEGLIYADAAPSTDAVLAPISGGLESVYQLRAPESPERLTNTFTLPDGASLEATPDGGAWVVQGDQAVVNVNPPVAVDAAGNPVVATMTVNGDELELDVSHSDSKTAYPIAVTTTATSLTSAAASAPQLGYNTIQAGSSDPVSNWSLASSTGKATWARVVSSAEVTKARQAMPPLNPIFITRPPTCDSNYTNWCRVTESTTSYYNYCRSLAINNPNVTAFEIMNEPNHDSGNGWTAPLQAVDYSTYAYYCDQGLRSVRSVFVLGASVIRGYTAVGSWGDWLSAFGYYTRYSAPDIIISSHIYPQGTELGSASDAASSVEYYLGWDLFLTGSQYGVNRGLTITEMGIKDGAQDGGGTPVNCDRKPNYLKMMFQRAGSNSTYNVALANIYRFSRNQGPNESSNWNLAGVYDSGLDGSFLNGYQDCGFSALASVPPS